MSCLTNETLARLAAEDLPVAEARAAEQHVATCEACAGRRRRTDELVAALAAPLPGLEDAAADSFVAATLGRLDRAPRRRVLPWRVLAAAAVVLLVLPASYLVFRGVGDRDSFRARGQRAGLPPALSTLAGVEPLVVRGDRWSALHGGSRMLPGDGLAFRYDNISDRRLYLMAFAVDAAGEVHWFYPAYRSARTDPASVALEPGVRGRLLPEVAQPEGVPSGRLRVVCLVSGASTTVKQVERRVAGRGAAPVTPLFPGAAVQEWVVHMEASDVER